MGPKEPNPSYDGNQAEDQREVTREERDAVVTQRREWDGEEDVE